MLKLRRLAPLILGISTAGAIFAGSAASVMATSAPAVVASAATHARPAHVYDG